MFTSGWSGLLTPQKATLESGQHAYILVIRIVSFRRLPLQFQFSLSAVTLGIYLGGGNISSL
jgi:hypothetical protein